MARRPTLEFWYEFASTYSYLAAMRIEAAAQAAGVEIRWRPFLLGPIFAAQGWNSSPFNLYPAKGRSMWRDLEREAARLGLPPVTRPDPFPQNSLSATRAAAYGMDHDWLVPFSKAVYESVFAEGPVDRGALGGGDDPQQPRPRRDDHPQICRRARRTRDGCA